MAANQDFADHLARAWTLHRQGQNDGAITDFKDLLQKSTNNVDALYGLGLAQRSAGQTEVGLETFEKCLAEVEAALKERPSEDRLQMLQKMTRQRISELSKS